MMQKRLEQLRELADIASACSDEICETIARAQRTCSRPFADAYSDVAGKAMGYIFSELVAPIYQAHPELEPEWPDDGDEASISESQSFEHGLQTDALEHLDQDTLRQTESTLSRAIDRLQDLLSSHGSAWPAEDHAPLKDRVGEVIRCIAIARNYILERLDHDKP